MILIQRRTVITSYEIQHQQQFQMCGKKKTERKKETHFFLFKLFHKNSTTEKIERTEQICSVELFWG